MVDAVATLGACDLYVDEYKIDACFSASQKVLGGPAGLAPVTFNARAMEAIANRKTPSNVYYYDAVYLSELFKCTEKPRRYAFLICLFFRFFFHCFQWRQFKLNF